MQGREHLLLLIVAIQSGNLILFPIVAYTIETLSMRRNTRKAFSVSELMESPSQNLTQTGTKAA
jgi:hypothetical protein